MMDSDYLQSAIATKQELFDKNISLFQKGKYIDFDNFIRRGSNNFIF